jgi:sugar lactone lactonase YvrE
MAQTAHFSRAHQVIERFSNPQGLKVDSNQNVYIADSGKCAVYKVPWSPGGYGTPVVVADATIENAVDFCPNDVTFLQGTMFMSDPQGQRILPSIDGPVYWYPSSGFSPFHPIQINGVVSGNHDLMYVAENVSDTIVELWWYNTTPATACAPSSAVCASTAASPAVGYLPGVATDSRGNVFYTTNGGFLCQIGAAPGTCQVISPIAGYYLALDRNHNFYMVIMDSGGARDVAELPWNGGSYGVASTVATAENFIPSFNPTGVALDSSNNLYISDSGTNDMDPNGYGPALLWKQGAFTPVFMPVNVNGSSVAPTMVTFTFDTGGTLGAKAPYLVTTEASLNLDFTDAGRSTCVNSKIYAAGATCNVWVNFNPKEAGLHKGVVQLFAQDGSIIANAYLAGTGVGPQVVFGNGVASTLASKSTNGASFSPYGTAVDAAGNVYLADESGAVTKFPSREALTARRKRCSAREVTTPACILRAWPWMVPEMYLSPTAKDT